MNAHRVAPAALRRRQDLGDGQSHRGIGPDLHVVVTASAATSPPVGSELDFFVTVSSKNVGSVSDVRLNLTLPAGYTVTHTYADRGPGCTGAASNLTCDVAWITGGTDTHVQIFGVVGVAGEQDITATVTPSPETELDSSDNTATRSPLVRVRLRIS
jgi:Domain of unknown function DUF11